MAEVKLVGQNTIRLECDCGKYVHEITAEGKDEVTVETFNREKKGDKGSAKEDKNKAEKSFFERLRGDE